jgi:hypothetical protein
VWSITKDSPASIGSEPMSIRRAATTVALLLLAASVCAGCSTTSSVGTPPSSTVAVPHGWKTYTYGKMAIAVPSNWAVKHDTNCPNAAAPGTLLLGLPAVIEQCAAFQYPMSVVTVSQLSSETSTTSVPVGQKPVTIKGIPVYLGFGSPSMVQWTVPSLDVQITGTGPDSSRVIHTLHKA